MQFTTLFMAFSAAAFATALPQPQSQSQELQVLEKLGGASPPQCLNIAKNMPTCGLQCLAKAAASVSCHPLDFTCNCSAKNHAAMKVDASACVVAQCSWKDAVKVQSVAVATCECAGEPIPHVQPPPSTPSTSSR